MKKTILAVAVLTISIASVKAQDDKSSKKTGISIAVNAGIPISSPSVYSFAFGADLQADFAATEGLKITASGGYENYSIKSSFGGGRSGFIPLLAGAKFNLGSDKVYGHAQLGYAFSTESGGGGAFAYAPSIGYYFSPNFDGSIKYLAFSKNSTTIGEIGVRLAYNF
ncbi:hypothetical protein FW778_03610 [Ginsengibacter hankyongi]|uniref:Outer membrane protein beta-barrel domain-containing protein n=1 Tax=Ginsengibacter hankyongi TaxID=2607284 RepID=A0A5J5IJI4_9BACT|nr:hypothetical protein [Ginsengibacter hankyongi]KAA9041136.1 hypothetical protein FW778_03610 [Ginsengibacter hankyongi]